MNRRATMMLVVGGVAGIASPFARADAGLRKKRSRPTSVAIPRETGGARDMTTRTAPQFQNLKEVGLERQVVAIHYHQDTYRVMTADGGSTDFWEANLRFKIDSSNTGPLSGKPVILPTGMMGDRASVFRIARGDEHSDRASGLTQYSRMHTGELIRLLAEDCRPVRPLRRRRGSYTPESRRNR
jgi:hypothetical protein